MCKYLQHQGDTLQFKELDCLYDIMLVFKRWDESKKILKKGVIEAWINMGLSIISSTYVRKCDSKFIMPNYEGFPDKSFPVFVDILNLLTTILKVMMESQSWNDSVEYKEDKENMLILVNKIQKKLQPPM